MKALKQLGLVIASILLVPILLLGIALAPLILGVVFIYALLTMESPKKDEQQDEDPNH